MAEADSDTAHLCDAISRLPDELLHTILEKIPLIDAVTTGFLSRRWRDVWKYISIVEFGPLWVQLTGQDVFLSLNQFIRLHKGQKIQNFSVSFEYQPEMSTHIDSWIHFAISKHVKDLHLDFDAIDFRFNETRTDMNMIRYIEYDPCYEIPPCVFNCKSLVRLILCCCVLELPMSIQLPSLKVLRLQGIELPQDAIQILTSNAPVLQYLLLIDCNSTSDLHINIAPNQHFHNLEIIEHFFAVNHRTRMFIKAPTAFQVAFLGSMPRSKYIIEEVSEYAQVHFSFPEMFNLSGKHRLNILGNDSRIQKYENRFQEILASCHMSNDIRMCNWCIQLLSLREIRNLERLKFNCTILAISCTFWKWELPGIIYMLKACPKVEELTLSMAPGEEKIKIAQDYLLQHDFQESRFLDNQNLGLELENLRTVRFVHGVDHQTWDHEYFDLKRFFNGAMLGAQFIGLLKNHAVNLQSLIFKSSEQQLKCFLKKRKKKKDEEKETTTRRSPPIRIYWD